MLNQFYKSLVLLFLFILLFTGCTNKIKIYQDTDQILNCNKLTTKIAEIIELDNNYIFSINKQISDGRFIRLINLKIDNDCDLNDRELNFISRNKSFKNNL